MSPAEFGEMTLGELGLAIKGFNDLEDGRVQMQLILTRKIIWYVLASQGAKDIKEEDIIPIKDLDEELEKVRRESLPKIEVSQDGSDGAE